MADAARVSSIGIVVTGIFTMIVGWATAFGLNQLWSLISGLQLIVYLPLFSVRFPGIATIFFVELYKVATFEIVEVGDYFADWFDLGSREGEQAPIPELVQVDTESSNFIANSGCLLLLLL